MQQIVLYDEKYFDKNLLKKLNLNFISINNLVKLELNNSYIPLIKFDIGCMFYFIFNF